MANGMDFLKPLVLDNGTASMKVGFAGDDAPSEIKTIIGHPRHPGIMVGMGFRDTDTYFGNHASRVRGVLSLKYPIRCGMVQNWDDMEKIWHNIFYNELRVSPESHPLLLTEPPFNPKPDREKTTEVMFESFHVPAMYVALQSVLSLYATGHTTGLVIESGEEVSYTIPIYEGHALPHAISKLELGGRDLTDYMMRYITETGEIAVNVERSYIEDCKKTCGYVALDFDKEIELAKTSPSSVEIFYELYYQQLAFIRSQRFRSPEALFRPLSVGYETSGIHEKAHDSIMKCDVDIRKSMYNAIVLSGGSTLFPGFADRVSKELSVRAPDNMKVKVIAPAGRIFAPWIGGSILASQDTFQKMWISRAEYDEYGPAIIHKKCF